MRTEDDTGILRRRAIDQMAFGALLLWGILLTPRQVGVIGRSVSALPIIMAAFGLLFVLGGISRLNRSRQYGRTSNEVA